MPSIPFSKSWSVSGTPTNLVAPDSMTLSVTDNTTGQVVVAAGTPMANSGPGQYEYVFSSAVAGHQYTALYTTVYHGTTYTSPPYTMSLAQPTPAKPPSPVDQINGYMAAAIAAQLAGDYARATGNALAAQGLIACLPKISRSAGTGGGEMAAQWDPIGIDNFIKRLRQQQGGMAFMQCVPVVMSEPTVENDGEQFANSTGGYVQ